MTCGRPLEHARAGGERPSYRELAARTVCDPYEVNVLLDSPDIAPATIRFLLWHEYLHLYLQQLHTPTFRELERKWPEFQAADRQLDTLNDRFGIQYW